MSIGFDVILSIIAMILLVLVLMCVRLAVDNRELKKQCDKVYSMYLNEIRQNAERLNEDIFREDLKILENQSAMISEVSASNYDS